MIARDLLPQIDPRLGSKYSPNLHGWIRKNWKNSGLSLVVTTPINGDGVRYIGVEHADGRISRRPLTNELCHRGASFIWAIPLKGLAVVDPDFWATYIRDGRCAIDPEHQIDFLDSEKRWKTEGDVRACQWCGSHVQVKLDWTETVHKSAWVAL